MRTTDGAPVMAGGRVAQKTALKRLPAVNAAALLKTMLLTAALSLTIATASSAQSYDPDLGSGNIARPGVAYGGGLRYGGWGRGIWTHRAEFRHHRARHHRHHRAR
jgi:hypothetical protein